MASSKLNTRWHCFDNFIPLFLSFVFIFCLTVVCICSFCSKTGFTSASLLCCKIKKGQSFCNCMLSVCPILLLYMPATVIKEKSTACRLYDVVYFGLQGRMAFSAHLQRIPHAQFTPPRYISVNSFYVVYHFGIGLFL